MVGFGYEEVDEGRFCGNISYLEVVSEFSKNGKVESLHDRKFDFIKDLFCFTNVSDGVSESENGFILPEVNGRFVPDTVVVDMPAWRISQLERMCEDVVVLVFGDCAVVVYVVEFER